MRIAVAEVSAGGWTGGQTYFGVAARSLTALAASRHDLEVAVVSRHDPHLSPARHIPLATRPPISRLERRLSRLAGRGDRVSSLPGERRLRQTLRLPNPVDPMWQAQRAGCDAVFPVTSTPPNGTRGIGVVGWVPDLQHRTHPEFFTASAAAGIDGLVQRLGDRSHRLVVSSQAVRAEVETFYPSFADKVRVLPFPSRLAFEAPAADCDVASEYHLPERFFLCANQFWRHKNHMLVLEALKRLRDDEPETVMVFTGLLSDRRDPTNQFAADLLQFVARHRLGHQARILGLVPRSHLDALLLSCSGVVQPSLSEGWSTTVEDAKALGTPVLALDTPILREQAPRASFFANDADDLARALREAPIRPQVSVDRTRAEALDFALAFAGDLVGVCEEAAHVARRRR